MWKTTIIYFLRSKCKGKGKCTECLESEHRLCCVFISTRWCCYCMLEVWVLQHKMRSPDVTKYFSHNKGVGIDMHKTNGDLITAIVKTWMEDSNNVFITNTVQDKWIKRTWRWTDNQRLCGERYYQDATVEITISAACSTHTWPEEGTKDQSIHSYSGKFVV